MNLNCFFIWGLTKYSISRQPPAAEGRHWGSVLRRQIYSTWSFCTNRLREQCDRRKKSIHRHWHCLRRVGICCNIAQWCAVDNGFCLRFWSPIWNPWTWGRSQLPRVFHQAQRLSFSYLMQIPEWLRWRLWWRLNESKRYVDWNFSLGWISED